MKKNTTTLQVKEKMQKVYDYIKAYTEDNNFPPTIREICKYCEIPSTGSAFYYVEKLIAEGRIDKANALTRIFAPKHYNKTFKKAPIIDKILVENTSIFDEKNIVSVFPLTKEFEGEKGCFAIKVKDNLMINSGIVKGDMVICKKFSYYSSGDLAAIVVNGCAIIRKIFSKDCILYCGADCEGDFTDIKVEDSNNIIGKVLGIVRKF